MPTCTTKHGFTYVDPGGDPAAADGKGGVVQVMHVVQSTQVSGWRQALINKAVAT